MRKQTVDIIGELVDSLGVVFNINTITPSGNYFILTTDCTWWLSIKDKITIGGNRYEIINFDINKEITINPLDGGTPTQNSFTIPYTRFCLLRSICCPTYPYHRPRLCNCLCGRLQWLC